MNFTAASFGILAAIPLIFVYWAIAMRNNLRPTSADILMFGMMIALCVGGLFTAYTQMACVLFGGIIENGQHEARFQRPDDPSTAAAVAMFSLCAALVAFTKCWDILKCVHRGEIPRLDEVATSKPPQSASDATAPPNDTVAK